LSVLVVVNFSVTAACALYHFGLEPEHFHGHGLSEFRPHNF